MPTPEHQYAQNVTEGQDAKADGDWNVKTAPSAHRIHGDFVPKRSRRGVRARVLLFFGERATATRKQILSG